MNKRVWIPLLGMLFLLAFAFAGHGAGMKVGAGLTAGYSMPSNANVSGGMVYGINIYYEMSKYLAVELGGLRFESDVTGAAGSLSDGKITSMPVLFTLQIRSPLKNGAIVPYVSLGIGYYMADFQLDNVVVAGWDAVGFDVEEKIENTLGFHLGAGMDFFVKPNIALNADFKYGMYSTEGEWAITERVTGLESTGGFDEINLDLIILTAGVKYFF